ncbi:KPN_02809 family neutral zinc metallopeptidase [Hamadaea tsunoensis]|uniref:KPN_02809 family neutral zinc metallopeptidase n=1 Tax=Hamadaea tsunoensis TaxID=53368 RepID=UPI000409C65A|nr:neutral zinc metallopeptidase [Hamadaea tsunoensis]
MSLNENADLDPSQVEDMRGSGGGGSGGGSGGFPGLNLPGGGGGGGGGGGMGPGMGGAAGCLGGLLPMIFRGGGQGGQGGGKGRSTLLIIVLVLVVCVGLICCLGRGNLGSLGDLGGLTGGGSNPSPNNSSLASTCSKSNPNRFDDPACRNLAYINSIQAFWQKELPQVYGKPYAIVPTRFFSGSVNTACGGATSGVGPFYCPGDQRVYIDLSFYDELASRFGAPGNFAQAYVLAHEYGHHVQNLLGTEAQVRRAQQRDPANANKYSVAMELQADCYAGVWAKAASGTTDSSGVPIFKSLTTQDLQEALTAAAAVGDDTIQQKAGQQINESGFTHGSAAQRQQWFSQGYQTGDPKQCNTFG